MHIRHEIRHFCFVTLLLINALCSSTTGSPVRNLEWKNDQWQEFLLLEGDSNPLLKPQNRTHLLPPSANDIEALTSKEFLKLHVNYTEVLEDTEDASARRIPSLVDKAFKFFNTKQVMTELETSVMSKVSCTACKAGVGLLQHYIRNGKTNEDIKQVTVNFCVSLKIQTTRVCEGITDLFVDQVVYVLKRIQQGPDEVCSLIIGDACGNVFNPTHDWDVIFPPVPKPTPVPMPVPKDGAPSFKVLHLSDTHYDPYYHEGSNAECNEPLCCRLTNGPAPNKKAAAGRWGDYRKCDTPKRTVDNMLEHIAHTHPDIDYILWTGDLPPHDVWNQTREENLMVIKESTAQMINHFPGIPIFPALGNHESAPVNSFPSVSVPQEFAINWLYDEMDKEWRKWLPDNVSRTVRRGAFYSVLVRPGFRIISLNMNYCNNKNWWLALNSTDPVKELQWFIYELQSAEFNKEKVHVIGHIPPGHSDCLKVWSKNYYSIINRYENTITAQFFGHTHYDEFEVFYDKEDMSRAVNIAYIGPSVTPYYDLNPGYRIYYIDGDHDKTTRAVVDHETWVMNLEEANLYNYPRWYREYTTRKAFHMPSLVPQEWDNLLNRMVDNETTFNLYYKYYWKNSPVKPTCDYECRKRMLCDLRSGRSHDRKILCQDVESRIVNSNGTGWRAWLYNSFALSRGLVHFTIKAWDTAVCGVITWWRSGEVSGEY